MSKVILVIDMPNSCEDCPCFNSDWGAYCNVTDKDIKYDYDNFTYIKPYWCPLKALPKEKDFSTVPYFVNDYYSYMMGRSDCLDEITSRY